MITRGVIQYSVPYIRYTLHDTVPHDVVSHADCLSNTVGRTSPLCFLRTPVLLLSPPRGKAGAPRVELPHTAADAHHSHHCSGA